jgi:hypothetical protein|tara:strand:- start:88 stop:738 length:651 start_codon:yes stop_codon:yes gene_type:complete
MGYFRELPEVEYQSFLSDSNSSQNYLTVKNLFRRNKLRDDLQNVFTIFNKYEIVDGARPDTVAEELYGSAELDWVVLMTANITRVRDQWPLSNRDLYKYAENKYGIAGLTSVHHYETTEVKDLQGRLILPAGKVVDENFSIPNPDNVKTDLNPVINVNNYEYEVRENDKKSSIYLLKPGYLQQFLNDMREIMIYGRSSEYINDNLIRTENTRVTNP